MFEGNVAVLITGVVAFLVCIFKMYNYLYKRAIEDCEIIIEN